MNYLKGSCISYRNGRLQIKIACDSTIIVDLKISDAQMLAAVMALSNLAAYIF